MALMKWSPLYDNFEDVDKMMSDMFPAVRNKDVFTPAVDMYEDEENVIVETELAGIDPEKVDVSIENDTLCIKGEGEKQSEVDDKNYYRKEIRRGNFYRSIPMPTQVIGEEATAETEDGVLKITVPKAPESKPKSIKIKSAKK